MKRFLCYAGSFLLLTVIFGFCYYSSYRESQSSRQDQGMERPQNDILNGLSGTAKELGFLGELSEKERQAELERKAQQGQLEGLWESQQTSLAQSVTILPTVEYYEETYTLPDKTLTSRQTVAPGFLIGMTRKELETYVSNYMQNLSISEYEAGLIAYEVVSFSEQKVVLRKCYDTEKVSFQFYVNISDGFVTVFYSDLKTVYEYTHIPAVELPEDIRFSLIDGIYVKDREELYSLLEGFSS